MLIAGLSCLAVLASAGTAHAQTLPPRPTPRPTAAPRSDGGHSGSSATSRITGTVIETTSGAPAPGIAVKVGDATVVTDANGNYDRNGLAAGDYVVALVLGAEQGTPAQGPLTIALGEGQTVVQHLAFSRPPAATVAPTAAPTATPVVPSRLPTTGGTDGNLTLWALLAAVAVLLGAGAMRASARAR
jgi:hypothetical protein